MADAHQPEGKPGGQPKGRPGSHSTESNQAEVTSHIESELGESSPAQATAKAESAGPSRLAHPVLRHLLAVGLPLVAIGLVILLTLDRSLPLWGIAGLAVLAAAAAGAFAWLFIPKMINDRIKQSVVVGVGLITFIVALLAIPHNEANKMPNGAESKSPGSTPTTPPASPIESSLPPEAEPDPLATTLRPGLSYGCEGWVIKNSLLKSVPKGKDLNAQWVYDHGGATLDGSYILTIQGKSKDAVIIDGLHVVDLKRESAPSDASAILPCTPYGGGQQVRYFDVLLQKRPRVIPRPAVDPDEKGRIQPAAKFPFKVSRNDPEYFQLIVRGPPCVCSWRVAIDWTSGDRSGTKIIDRKFSNIRTNTTYHAWDLPFYWRDTDGTWNPPLPK